MLESIARTKQCRAPGVAHEAGGIYYWPNCTASGCMHWQWEKGGGNTDRMRELAQARVDSLPQEKKHGYCGLSRK